MPSLVGLLPVLSQMRFRLRTLLIVLVVPMQRLARWLSSRRWLTFSLRGMFVFITLLGIWLGWQVNWLRQRQDARKWIEQHEVSGGWSRMNPSEMIYEELDGSKHFGKAVDAPWSLRVFGESRLAYIRLDKSKLSEDDIARIDSLMALFPEAEGVAVQEPGMVFGWPPADRRAYLKYPTRIVGGKVINEPVDADGSDSN
jgi:hypothetical protein